MDTTSTYFFMDVMMNIAKLSTILYFIDSIVTYMSHYCFGSLESSGKRIRIHILFLYVKSLSKTHHIFLSGDMSS